MDQNSLVDEQLDAGGRFLSEFQKYRPVQSAFWLKDNEGGTWYLYVASDQITDDYIDVGYGEVLRSADAIHDPWFDPFQVKLIGADDPLARAATDIRRRYPIRKVTRFPGYLFENASADEAYIYPPSVPAPVS